jgi:hypothetical protein
MWGTRFILVRGNAGNSDNASQASPGADREASVVACRGRCKTPCARGACRTVAPARSSSRLSVGGCEAQRI